MAALRIRRRFPRHLARALQWDSAWRYRRFPLQHLKRASPPLKAKYSLRSLVSQPPAPVRRNLPRREPSPTKESDRPRTTRLTRSVRPRGRRTTYAVQRAPRRHRRHKQATPMKATYRVSALDSLFLVVLAALVTPVHAARAQRDTVTAAPRVLPSSTELRLADLYALAARSSPRIEAATAQARAAGARIASAERPPDPQLQLGFMNRSLPSLRPMDPLGMTQIQVMQMIPTPGKLGLAGRIAADNAAAARERAADVRWDVRAKAAMSYYDLYVTDAQIRIARNTKNLVQDIAKISQVMYSVGDGKQAEVLRAQ